MKHLKNENMCIPRFEYEKTLINRRHVGLPQKRWRPTLMKSEKPATIYPVSDDNHRIMFNH
jgi:hypothetical protein